MWALAQRQYGSTMEDDKPPLVRMASYMGPTGLAFLLLAIFTSASTWVCTEECVRTSDVLEDRLLACMDRCEEQTEEVCRRSCNKKIGFSRREVTHQQVKCESDCDTHSTFVRFLTFCGVLIILPVSPFVGNYSGSCKCDCCIGQGCNPRIALYCLSWTAYGFSVLWLAPSLFENPSEIGGKALFAVCQATSMMAMVGSRRIAERNDNGYTATTAGGHAQNGSHAVGVMVGAPVHGPSTLELQQQVMQLQHQVRELTRIVMPASQQPSEGKVWGPEVVAGLPVASQRELQELRPASPPQELL